MDNLEVKLNSENDELVVRTGAAKEIPDPIHINIKGTPGTVYDFMKQRGKEIVKTNDSYVNVDTEQGIITLEINKTCPETQGRVVSVIQMDTRILKFNINSGRPWETKSLAKLIRMNVDLFDNTEAARILCSKLNSVVAKIDKTIEDSKDDRGGYKKAAEQVVKTDIPEVIVFNSSIIKGGEKQKFEVMINFDIMGNELHVHLESPQFEQVIRDEFEQAINKEVKDINSLDGYLIVNV